MTVKGIILLLLIGFSATHTVKSQALQAQQGAIFRAGTNELLLNVQIINKQNPYKVKPNGFGTFSILAKQGDTLEITGDGYNEDTCIVSNFSFKNIYLKPSSNELKEVVISVSSLQQDLQEAQNGYRKKAVFYTGAPHYYYIFLKPMTFIYENFKSEVIQARHFKKFAHEQLENDKIYQRFNSYTIKKAIPINDEELGDFKSAYYPTVKQITAWSDYDLDVYLKKSYKDYLEKSQNEKLISN